MRFTSTVGSVLAGSLFLSSALGRVARLPKRQDRQLAEYDDVEDVAEDLIDELEDVIDDNEDEFELLEEASDVSIEKRSIVVRATPDGFTSAEMGEEAAVDARVYTEGLSSCIGMLVSGTTETGETVNVLYHLVLNSEDGIKDQWKKFQTAVYGAGYTGISRVIMSSSDPAQLTPEAMSASETMGQVNGIVGRWMTSFVQEAPEDFPHMGNQAHILPHGTIKADGATIEVNGQAV